MEAFESKAGEEGEVISAEVKVDSEEAVLFAVVLTGKVALQEELKCERCWAPRSPRF